MAKALYNQIADSLRNDIESGEYNPGDKIPTEQDLAEKFHVSRITTTKAMNVLENDGLVYRVKGSGTFVREMKYWQHENRKSTNFISFISPFSRHTGNGYMLIDGAESQAKKNRQLLTVHNSEGDIAHEKEIILDLLEHGSRGMIVYPIRSCTNQEILSQLLVDRTPLVTVDRKVTGIECDFCGPDNFRGFSDLVRHLSSLGHRRIAMAATTITKISSEMERYHGYCSGLVSEGIPIDRTLVFIEDEFRPLNNRDDNDSSNTELAQLLLDVFMNQADPPTAIMCVNDLIAVEVLNQALVRGIRVPEQLSITGFDDLPFAAHVKVPLTTMAQPFLEIGGNAVRLLQERIRTPDKTPETLHFPTRLIARESTAPPEK